ncbi:hypothetical protein U9029_22055 [Escherichia coli]
MSLTELEVAERIRDGTVPSPVKFSNMWLVNLRITGTGLAYRAGLKEHVWRDPKLYRKRALIAMQKHSPAHKDVNIRAIADSATLAVLEDAIFSAARQSIEKEMMSTQGQLHKRIRNDEAGRRITEYQGDPNVWLSAFKIPGRRLAKINTQGNLNNG